MHSFAKKYNAELLISGLGFLIVVALLWIPFGFKTTDIADGWINLPKVERTDIIKLIGGSRPLVYLPWKLGYLISKDSYLGVGLVLAALFWGRAFVFYWILRNLRLAVPSLAFFMAILFILYPADQGIFLMRALGRHTAVFFYFLALLLLIFSNRRSHPAYLIGMMLAEGISALIAEQGFLLMFVTPLLLLVDKEHPTRKKTYIAISWYAVLSLAIVNFLLAAKGHQEKILADAVIANNAQYFKEIILSNLFAYRQVFATGWLKAFEKAANIEGQYALFGIAITITAIYISELLTRTSNSEDEPWVEWNSIIVILAGLAIVSLTFFPYSLTSFRYVYSRVFYYAAGGGSLVLGIIYSQVIQRFPRWKKNVDFVFWGIIIFIISCNGLAQRASLVKISQRQQEILVDIVEQAPSVKSDTTIVLLCEKKKPFTGLDYVFRAALSWTYKQENIRALQCESLSDCDKIPYETSMIFECKEDNDVILLQQLPVEPQFKNINYQPYDRIKSYVPFPERAQVAFDFFPNASNLSPQKWVGGGQSLNDRKVCDVSYQGSCSLLFFNDETLTTFSQMIEVAGNANEHFKLSFWGKSERAMSETIPLAALTVFYKDGTEEEFSISAQLYKKWTLQQLVFETDKPYSSMFLQFHPTTSALIWLDDIHLVSDNSEIVIYNLSFEK
jgi:hypothetical protein